MMYAPRAIRHFSLASLESQPERASRPVAAGEPANAVRPLRPVRPARSRFALRLWLPLTPIFLLLAPFALLLAPLIYLAPAPYRTRPFVAVLGVGHVLLSMSGTEVDVETPEALVRIRIF